MRYCKGCVNVNTRPDIGTFDNEGLCPVCQVAKRDKNNLIDFSARRRELDKIIAWGRKNSKSSYDCIVTVSGGKDSMRQSFYARDELKVKPLLVSYVYPPQHQVERGAYNLSNLVSQGFDTITVSLNPQVSKKLMRHVFFKYGNIFKATELALYAVPIHVAIAYKIPLIFLGENPLYTIGMKQGDTSAGDATGMKYCHTLKDGSSDFIEAKGVTNQDIYFYSYPPDEDIEYAQLRIVYLGYYIKDWSELNNAQFAIQHGLKTRDNAPEKTGQLYPFTCLDEDFYPINQMIKYVKYGFGATTDQVVGAIKQGIMKRKEGFDLVKKYDGKCDISYIKNFCRYIDITLDEFWQVVEEFRNRNIWEKDKREEWQLKVSYPDD